MKLVDSSIWVEFLRKKGDPAAKQMVGRLIQSRTAAFTCPIRFELLSGVRQGEAEDLNLAFSFSEHVPFETSDWVLAADLERDLRAKGLTIPRNDIFVAAVAVRAQLPLVCRDAHFDAISKAARPQLQVEQA